GLHTQQIFWAALAVARNLGLSTPEIFAGAKQYQPLFGRGERLERELKQGGKITLLQDCYNASPESLYALLKMLHSWGERGLLPPCVLVLGDMLELGSESLALHEKVAELIAGYWGKRIPQSLCVLLYGPMMRQAWLRLAAAVPFCRHLENAEELEQAMVSALRACTQEPPLLVLKGARSMYLEKIAANILL
ncbi:MAG: hypothetical protein AAF975_08080, partial [Spirochaetota bacterium]